MRAVCLICGSTAGTSVTGRGICAHCQATKPAFIPVSAYKGRDTITPGYNITARGLVRYDQSSTARSVGDAPAKHWQGQISAPEQNRKRTPQERLDSLTQRLVRSFGNGNIPESMLREIQAEGIARGNWVSMDALRQLAALYLNRAAKETGQAGPISVRPSLSTGA